MLNCKQSSELISQALDEELPLFKRMMLKVHIITCPGCAIFSRQLSIIHKIAPFFIQKQDASLALLPDDAKTRIAEAMKSIVEKG
ncbi:MAG: zf-HC2 domain-containing protein [Methylotenera sp.]|uniref:zf-HC2 domain-containing protein n=1 Tax=Methylotenera sp. TaxID=2051956 RepID=UPI00248718BC|nr:zf-HC2 domain-containing protein [Methylotenera sp.]MDI1309310.1 zf-HC2 domain-containing protein [Methylotenera sp.]